MPPVMVPIVHANVLGLLDISAIPGPEPLHVFALEEFVTAGVGYTVSVIVKGRPEQEPVVEVGVTMYSTVPTAELLKLFNGWLIIAPAPPLAPIILPIMVPIVHENVLGVVEIKTIPGPVPLQVLAVGAFVIAGAGFTVTVIVKGAPTHKPVVEVGVTIYFTVPVTELLGLISV